MNKTPFVTKPKMFKHIYNWIIDYETYAGCLKIYPIKSVLLVLVDFKVTLKFQPNYFAHVLKDVYFHPEVNLLKALI